MSATPLIQPPEPDFIDSLKGAAPFADLPDPVLKAIGEICEERRYAAGEQAFTPGQYDGSEIIFVCEGRLKAAFADATISAIMVEEFGAGDFLGLAAAIAGADGARGENVTVTAEENSRVLAIEAAGFAAIVAQRPSLTRSLMRYFAAALAESGLQPAEDGAPQRRVFAARLEHVERDAIHGDWRIPRMPKHRELAEKAGADEAVAAGAVAQLIQDGVAHRDYPGLVIADMARLSRLAS